jgi:hypothetical protein
MSERAPQTSPPVRAARTEVRRPLSVAALALFFALASLTAWLACDPRQSTPKPLVRRAEFGVLFGGQIQERRELPFELDRSKQTLGFRVEFSEPLGADTDIEWRVDRPARSARVLRVNRRAKPLPDAERPPLGGKETARAGELRFDRTVSFEPGDPLGLWNVRVVVRGRVVLDRPFEVFDPDERQKNGTADAGF